MSFSEFQNIPEVQKKYGIKYQEDNFIPVEDRLVSAIFREEFEFNLLNMDAFASEAARCEIIIFPILREIYKSHSDTLALWVQKAMTFDADLTGTPDYLISKRSEYGKLLLETPLLAIVEAKKNDFEQGWGQALAELIAAQKLNNDEALSVYGIVTDGKRWEFGYLKQQSFIKNQRGFSIDDLAQLFSALDFIFQQIDV